MKSIIISLLFLSSISYANDLIKRGADLYDQRQDLEKVYEALELFEQHLEKDPSSIEALWRASMSNYYIGHLITQKSTIKQHYEDGIAQARKCVEVSKGKKVECYFWLATNLALLKQENGLFSMAFGLGEIFENFEKAKGIDPTYAGAGPYRMLALLSNKAPGILGGDEKKAFKYIRKAIELRPDEPLNIYLFAKFLSEDDRKVEAMKVLIEFESKADTKKFVFLESHNAYKNIKHYIKTKEWLE